MRRAVAVSEGVGATIRGLRTQERSSVNNLNEEIGEFNNACKDQILVKVTNMNKVPKFNRPVFMENKS